MHGSCTGTFNNGTCSPDNNRTVFSHIDWHLEAGLAVVFAEDPPDSRAGNQSQIIKQTWLDLCPIYDALPPNEQ